jgi:hypothetical protein
MIAMYDAENKRVILLMTPAQLRGLADTLEAQAKEAVAGDSTIGLYLPIKDFWCPAWTDMTLAIGYSQS